MTSFLSTTDLDRHSQESGDSTFVRAVKSKHTSEQEFKKWICDKAWDGFVTRVEPGLGGDTGNPDLFIQPDCLPGMLGIELKIGNIKGGTLYTDDVRPAQISWHSRLAQQGGISMFLVHTPDGLFAFDGMYCNQWQDGYSISGHEANGAWQISHEASTFSASLESFIENVLCG